MPSKITDFIKKKYGELTTPTVDESSNMETNKVKTDTMRSNSKFNTKLKEKNNVLREYAQIKGLLANMSPEKRQAYSGLVESLYSPMLKPYIKQETVGDMFGGNVPAGTDTNQPFQEFEKTWPYSQAWKKEQIANKTLGDMFPDGNVPDVFKGISPNTNFAQAIQMATLISNSDKAIMNAIIQMMGTNLRYGGGQ